MEFWIRDMKNVLFISSYYDLKGYENSQNLENVGIKPFTYKRWVLFCITLLHVHLTSIVQYIPLRTNLEINCDCLSQ
jgi:hypothetical protein